MKKKTEPKKRSELTSPGYALTFSKKLKREHLKKTISEVVEHSKGYLRVKLK